jgi:hypothetical protein
LSRQAIASARCFLKSINQLDLSRQDLRSRGFQIEPLGAIDFWKGFESAAPRRPLDLEAIAGQRRGVEVSFRAEGDHALAAALADLSERLQGADRG